MEFCISWYLLERDVYQIKALISKFRFSENLLHSHLGVTLFESKGAFSRSCLVVFTMTISWNKIYIHIFVYLQWLYIPILYTYYNNIILICILTDYNTFPTTPGVFIRLYWLCWGGAFIREGRLLKNILHCFESERFLSWFSNGTRFSFSDLVNNCHHKCHSRRSRGKRLEVLKWDKFFYYRLCM